MDEPPKDLLLARICRSSPCVDEVFCPVKELSVGGASIDVFDDGGFITWFSDLRRNKEVVGLVGEGSASVLVDGSANV